MKANAPTIWELESEAESLSPRTVAALVSGVLVALYAVALLLVARRTMGAFTAELPWQAVLVTAVMSLAIISGLRILWRRAFPEPTASEAWIGWGASLTLVLIAAGVSFPRGETQDWMLWLPVLVADQMLRRRLFEGFETVALVRAQPRVTGNEWQCVVRTRDAAGSETVVATLRADFVAGQRNATVYLGFCPPLAQVPEVAIAPIEGAEIKLVQAFAHGLRVDVRLTQAATGGKSLALEVTACCESATAADDQ